MSKHALYIFPSLAVIQRVVAPENRQSYAIAGPFMGNSSADEAVLPRTKSGVDLPNGPYVTSGTISAGILAIGGASVAQTYEGEEHCLNLVASPIRPRS